MDINVLYKKFMKDKEFAKMYFGFLDEMLKEEGLYESFYEDENKESLNEVYPNKGENKKDFINRFMRATSKEYPDVKQRYAIANSYWERRHNNKLQEDV